MSAWKILFRSYNIFFCIVVTISLLFLYYLSLTQNQDLKLRRSDSDSSSGSASSSYFSSSVPPSVVLPTTAVSSSSGFNSGSDCNLEKAIKVFNQIGTIYTRTPGPPSICPNVTTYSTVLNLMKADGLVSDGELQQNSTTLATILLRLKEKYESIQLAVAYRHKNSLQLQAIALLAAKSKSKLIASQSQSPVQTAPSHNRESRRDGENIKIKINLAVVACGQRRTEAQVMLKSALLFSHGSHLHVIMFSDKATILNVAGDLMELKWTANALGRDITFELHLDWFPPDQKNKWKEMYTPCATQRLFFPSLLPHIDSLMYLDTDIIVVSNLTEFWLQIPNGMKDTKMAGMSPNNEPTAVGWYNTMSKIPYYGIRGLNAGVMLMNLTQMRNFSLEERAMSARTVYKEKIDLADQDILNIIFHTYPEKLHVLDCSYNFNWVHCGIPKKFSCINETTGESNCFCKITVSTGVKLIHGNGYTFHNKVYFMFLTQLYEDFLHLDLLQDSATELFQNLKTKFDQLPEKPCHPLTSAILYDNALQYLAEVQLHSENCQKT